MLIDVCDFCCQGAGSGVGSPSVGPDVLGSLKLSGRIVELPSASNNCCI